MAFDKSKFIARFVDEAREHVKTINDGLLRLEKDPDETETIGSIFRSAHTIKGSSKMLNLKLIPELSHKLEDALDALRKNKINHSKALSDLFFNGIDMVSDMIEQLAEGKEIATDIKSICGKLTDAANGEYSKRASAATKPVETETKKVSGSMEVAKKEKTTKAKKIDAKSKKKEAEKGSPPKQERTRKSLPENDKKGYPKNKSVIDETIRISALKLDETIKLMEEMVSHQSRVKHKLYDIKELESMSRKNMDFVNHLLANGNLSSENGIKDEIVKLAHSLYMNLKQLVAASRDDVNLQELLTSELQGRALRMRMLPLSTVFDTFSRSVRDISNSFGKKINLQIEGEDTELDKKMIEKIGDPLLHMIRNSIDHGIEMPEERISAGKPEVGTINLFASYEGGNVLIELSDDGGGLAMDKIKEKALQRKLVDEHKLKNMSESEIVDLIFHPGFSTSAIITDISGRGVGMDVVKKNIVDQLNGSIQIKTKQGEGTSFFIRLPLTLAIMRVVQIMASDLIFAISENSVTEILKVPKTEIIDVVNRKAIRLREQIIPVVNLHDLLSIPGKKANKNGNDLLVLIVFMGSEQLGLIVDSILDEEDMVIKPLPSHMKGIQWVSGVTISGKNEVINILHIPKLINAAKEMKDERRFVESGAENKKAINILLVEDSLSTREIEKSVLESYGYKVDVAGDGIEALEKTKDFKYDLVVTDVEMPRLDGFSLTERLRKESEYEHTPIIIVTSLDKVEDKKRGIKVGADAYIVKGSFEQSNLLDTVQNLVGT